MSARARGELRAVRAAGGARRGGGGARRGAGARRGRPLPLPSSGRAPRAAGVFAPGREMWPPLRLLAGNARGGPCRAERLSVPRDERSWARSGRGVPAVSALRAPRAGPGPAAVLLGVCSRTWAAAGVGVTEDAGPERRAPWCKLHAGQWARRGGCALRRPAPWLLCFFHPGRWSPLPPLSAQTARALRRPGAHQAPAARPWNGHLAAGPRAWPPAGRGAGDGWAQPGLLAACPRLKAAPLPRRECQLLRAGCRAERRGSRGATGRGARGHRAATSPRGFGVQGSRAGGAAAASPPANSAGLLVLLMF